MATAFCSAGDADVPFEVKLVSEEKGRGLIASRPIGEGETILAELPLVSAQFSWNKSCGYIACDHCLRPLETAEENVRRLTKNPNRALPFPELQRKEFDIVVCLNFCEVQYCSDACRATAWDSYHKLLCPGKSDAGTEDMQPLALLEEAWKPMHFPPETSSISLVARIVASIRCVGSVEEGLERYRKMCSGVEGSATLGLAHKLLGSDFKDNIDVLLGVFTQALYGDDLREFFAKEGFTSLLALVARNGQGIGTSPLADWVRRVEESKSDLVSSPEHEQELDKFIDNTYDEISDVTGLEFMNTEGSGLYEIQSCINHSCEPNAEVKFRFGCHKLAIVALRGVRPGEEICTSYLDECSLNRSRHSRQKLLKENYVFICQCPKCVVQASDPDVTSEEEDDEEEDDESAEMES